MKKIKQTVAIVVCFIVISLFHLNESAAQTFIDVPDNHTHAENIARLNGYNIINGYGNGYFGVNDPILREHAVLLIYKILKDEKEAIRTYIPFSDVKTTHSSYEAIRWAYERGIIDGANGKFNPQDFVTREQMAKILVNAFDIKANENYKISDVAFNHWAYPYINTLRGNNLTYLYENQFFPSSRTKRGEMASFLVRTVDYANIELKTFTPPTTSIPNVTDPLYDAGWDMKWHVIKDAKTLHLKGYSNNSLVGEYIKGNGKSLEGISIGMTKKEVEVLTTGKVPQAIQYKDGYYRNTSTNEKITFESATRYVTVFFDIHNNHKVTGILAIDKTKYLQKPYYYPASAALQESYEDLKIILMNQSRKEFGLSELVNVNDQWNTIARKHSEDMILRNYFAHDTPEGIKFYDRMANGGLKILMGAENLAMGTETVIHAHEALMNSIGHRNNILLDRVTHAYVGVHFNSSNSPYITINMYK